MASIRSFVKRTSIVSLIVVQLVGLCLFAVAFELSWAFGQTGIGLFLLFPAAALTIWASMRFISRLDLADRQRRLRFAATQLALAATSLSAASYSHQFGAWFFGAMIWLFAATVVLGVTALVYSSE